MAPEVAARAERSLYRGLRPEVPAEGDLDLSRVAREEVREAVPVQATGSLGLSLEGSQWV